MSTIDDACAIARTGKRIFPTRHNPGGDDDKNPMPGYGWVDLATCTINEVVEDFDRAIQLWGEEGTSISWALGMDGYFAVDVDVPVDPTWMAELEDHAGINYTIKGRHLIFKAPDGMNVGNSTAGFPDQGWGDIRGHRGYIVVHGPGRRGLDYTTEIGEFPHPEWLREWGGGANAITLDEAKAFSAKWAGPSKPNQMNWLHAAIEGYDHRQDGTARGRHSFATWAMVEAAEEAIRGHIAFADGLRIIRDWWRSVVPQERWGREWRGIVTWAIPRAEYNIGLGTEADAQDGSPDDALLGDNSSPYVDWGELLNGEMVEHDWLYEPIWPAGRQVAMHAKAKTGKSLFAFYMALELALGVDLATGERRGDSQRVMYVDYEMDDNEIVERARDFGVTPAMAEALNTNLLYAHSTGEFVALDTAHGAAAFLHRVDLDRPNLIVIDTIGRAVDGEEDSADTIRAFYRFTGSQLRQRSIPYLRVDHTGKSEERGARGTSAKNDDVDLIWSMQRTADGFKVTSTSRVSWVPKSLYYSLRENSDRRWYERSVDIDEVVADEPTTRMVYLLAELGATAKTTRSEATALLVQAGFKPGRTAVLAKSLKQLAAILERGGVVGVPDEIRVEVALTRGDDPQDRE